MMNTQNLIEKFAAFLMQLYGKVDIMNKRLVVIKPDFAKIERNDGG